MQCRPHLCSIQKELGCIRGVTTNYWLFSETSRIPPVYSNLHRLEDVRVLGNIHLVFVGFVLAGAQSLLVSACSTELRGLSFRGVTI